MKLVSLVAPAVLALTFVPRLAHAAHGDVSTLAILADVKALRVDSNHNLWVVQRGPTHALRKFAAPIGNTPPVLVSSAFTDPDGLALDSHDNMYIPDYLANVVYKVTPAGTRTVFATGFTQPSVVAVDASDNVYVGEILGGGVIERFTPGGVSSVYGNANLQHLSPLLTQAGENRLVGMAFDRNGNLYCGTYGPAALTSPFALSYIPAGGGTGVQLPPLPHPAVDFALDAPGNFYTAGYQESVIGSITPAGTYANFAGTGIDGYLDGPLLTARFNYPSGVALDDATGLLYVADYKNDRVRVVDPPASPVTRTSWGRVKALYRGEASSKP